ncbi:DUF4136 domain-containing protein [Seongchinamella sediminis]|uniref:DUF4136 domain-containing protein n=1 Tax=Seongchinamella sediminis TaxID=2283635 RepID=A0A3L7E0Q6_9GAMM|nr:DUF4136 domain-containing protein [Seongchinamella sediminis]RLQ23427.1 DUF4136 domain-containing protein [Seongchinamella sediminis]
MRTLTVLLLFLAVSACSNVETRPGDTAAFAAGDYRYYSWRSEPLANTRHSADLLYLIDPVVRREVNAALAKLGYVEDPGRAQFNVDYLQAMGLREGVKSQDASGGIDPIPSARPNRQINQAMVDNANALAGVQTTNNIAIQFNDSASQREIWRVVITSIVENSNKVDVDYLERKVSKAVSQAFRPLPRADQE